MPALDGRRLWFVGIGGAGLSAYAQLARAWGAEVGGWDRVDTPYLEPLRGRRGSSSSPEPVVPEGWEPIVSSAYPGVPGRPRGDFLAELVGLRRSIVVAGAHGKGTTAAMIAFVLRETGRDPAWLIGAPVPQLGLERGRGGGLARRRGRRVRPLGVRAPGRDRGRHERRARSPHGVPLARRARGGVRALDRVGAGRRARRAAVRGRARRAGRAQPPQRGRCARGARARGRPARRGAPPRSPGSPGRAGGSRSPRRAA